MTSDIKELRPMDLVGITEIAKELGVKPNVVSNWIKRHEDFPKPFAVLAMGRIWLWIDIKEWWMTVD